MYLHFSVYGYILKDLWLRFPPPEWFPQKRICGFLSPDSGDMEPGLFNIHYTASLSYKSIKNILVTGSVKAEPESSESKTTHKAHGMLDVIPYEGIYANYVY